MTVSKEAISGATVDDYGGKALGHVGMNLRIRFMRNRSMIVGFGYRRVEIGK